MKKKTIIISTFAVLLISTSLLWGHGIKVSLEEKRPYVNANARYHGGKVLGNARVTVSFADGNMEFQTGNTDQEGNFRFRPDKPGTWTVLVDDLTGHRGKKTITLSEEFFNIPTPPVKEDSIPPTSSTVETAKEEIASATEEKPSPNGLPVNSQEGKNSPAGSGEFCCYLLKIVLGVVLILVATYIFYRQRKGKEARE